MGKGMSTIDQAKKAIERAYSAEKAVQDAEERKRLEAYVLKMAQTLFGDSAYITAFGPTDKSLADELNKKEELTAVLSKQSLDDQIKLQTKESKKWDF